MNRRAARGRSNQAGRHAFLLAAVSPVLSGGVRRLLGDALATGPSSSPPRGQFRFLRVVERMAGDSHRCQHDARLPDRPENGCQPRTAGTQGADALERQLQSRRALLFQVRQFLPAIAAGRPSRRRCIVLVPRAVDHSADRHLVLHIRGDQLHHRRLPPQDSRGEEPAALHAVHPLLPPPDRGPDRPATSFRRSAARNAGTGSG